MSSVFWRMFLTTLQLFGFYRTFTILQDIVRETNRYAAEVDGFGNTMDSEEWKEFTVPELKVFMAIWLYMGMKRQLNIKSYWHKQGSIFHCSIISSIMTRSRFIELTRCLHIINPATYVREKDLPGYDKLRQVRWLIEYIKNNRRNLWTLGKYCTIDEMMICYMGSYCPLRQYMPQKPQNRGIKVWCLACSTSKYMWNFSIYCKKTQVEKDVHWVAREEPKLAHKVVLDPTSDICKKGHVMAMDNFFTIIGLFMDLYSRGIYTKDTMRSNRIALPNAFWNTKVYTKKEQGWMDWRMHASRTISTVVWKDKKPILLLSTHV